MRHSLVLAASVLALLAMSAESATAKPKRDPIGNCTMQQLQTPGARACLKKHDQDVMAGRALQHVVYCSSSGALLCCHADGAGKIQDHTCSVVSRMQKKLEGVKTPSVKGGAAAP